MPTFTGTSGDDTLTGGEGEDIILGLDGNDRLSTSRVFVPAPATPLPVTNIRDLVRGGEGNDTISAFGISNGTILYGDGGDDTITVDFSGVTDIRSSPEGSFYFYTAVDGEPVQIFGGTGNDTISTQSHAIIDGGDGDDVISTRTSTFFVSPRETIPAGFDTTVRLTGGSGADVFVISNPVGTAIITDFQAGIDRLNLAGSGVRNAPNPEGRVVLGRQGNDTLLLNRDEGTVYARLLDISPTSLTASSFLDNSVGAPSAPGFPSTLTYLNVAGPIFDVGTTGSDTIQGVGATFWYGGAGNDVARAGVGDSILNGDDGDDLLVGGIGADTLRGGAGDDRLQGGEGGDILLGGAGIDILVGGAGADVLTGGAGLGDHFRYTAYTDSNAASGTDIILDFQERYAAGAPADVIDLSGLAISNLTLVRTGFNQTLIFATTADGTLQIASNARVGGEDVLATGVAGLTMIGSSQLNLFELIIAGPGADTIYGLEGSDSLVGGLGADLLYGGSGGDTFYYWSASDSTAGASDVIMDFETGVDQIHYSSRSGGTPYSAASATIVRLGGSSYVFTDGSQLIALGRSVNGGDLYSNGSRILSVTLIGSDAGDVMTGTWGDDVIVGGNGGDVLEGSAGRDVFRYAAASESTAAAFDRLVDFETGIDTLDLTALGATSISILHGRDSSFVFAETPRGSFMTTTGRPINGSDIVHAGGFGVYTIGWNGNDTLIGTSLADPIQGGEGNDVIIGGGGADVLFGEGGADTFVYLAASDSTVAAADTIFGFVSGQDRLDLSAVRAGASDTFGIAYANGGSFLFVDLGGNGSNDMLIQLAGTTLVASDIRWSAGAGDLEPAVKDAGPAVLLVSDDVDAGWSGLGSIDDGRMLFLADGGLASQHGHDWYL